MARFFIIISFRFAASRVFTRPNCVARALDWFRDKGGEGTLLKFRIEDQQDRQEHVAFLDWTAIPPSVHPLGGELPPKRLIKKCQQLESLARAVMSIAEREGSRNLRIVDFCSGGGHLGILLAHLLPESQVLLVENKEDSLRRAYDRIRGRQKNVSLYQCNLAYFVGQFDVGISLHACGSATDMVLDKCLKAGAHFVSCPCCYGSIRTNSSGQDEEEEGLTYPRSKRFADFGWSVEVGLVHSLLDTCFVTYCKCALMRLLACRVSSNVLGN